MLPILFLVVAIFLSTGYTGLILHKERTVQQETEMVVSSDAVLITRAAAIAYMQTNPVTPDALLTDADLSPFFPTGYKRSVISGTSSNWQAHIINGDLFFYYLLAPSEHIHSHVVEGLTKALGGDELMGTRVDIGGTPFIRPINQISHGSAALWPSPPTIPVNAFVIIGS